MSIVLNSNLLFYLICQFKNNVSGSYKAVSYLRDVNFKHLRGHVPANKDAFNFMIYLPRSLASDF